MLHATPGSKSIETNLHPIQHNRRRAVLADGYAGTAPASPRHDDLDLAGVNDAPSLTRADVGIAVGSGTDVAIESAGIVLIKSNPMDVVKVFILSRASYNKMIQNLLWGTGYNVIALPPAAGAPAWAGLLLSPAAGAALMSLNTMTVALNAQLLRRTRL